MTGSLDGIEAATLGWLETAGARPLVLGLCGAQGSGKSTVAAGLAGRLTRRGLQVATLSLDDLYLSGVRRQRLAETVHPLLRTRGVPLTHDVEHGRALIHRLREGQAVRLPRFDKARDEPRPPEDWAIVDRPLDLLVFEGWCVGAQPQDIAALDAPVNSLEREEDGAGVWRRAVNAALSDSYAGLFGMVDRLVLLAAPGFDVVRGWRLEQEQAMRASLVAQGRDARGVMDAAAIDRFVQHYERITRWILEEMPGRADLVVHLDAERRPLPGPL